MKHTPFIILACLLIISCNNKADQPASTEDTVASENMYSWQATLNDSTGRLEMKKMESPGPDTLTPEAVVNYLNTTNPNIKLELAKASGDTVYLAIPDAMYLTQQMGSTGPTLYFANVVYNLTEIPGYNFVRFLFEEGDHASPGTYNRGSFKDE